MKKPLIIIIAAITVAVCVGLTACTMKLSDPSSITDEKAKLESVRIKTENGTWQDLSGDAADKLFDMVKSLGELSGEPYDVAVSGSSTIETTYDYEFTMTFTTGNFFLKKRGEFTYYVGERFKRTSSDGKVKERITEEKLVVKRTLTRDAAMLTEAQLQLVKDTFEPINASVMNAAFEKVVTDMTAKGYDFQAIPAEDLASELYTLLQGGPLDAEDNLIKGYKVLGSDGTNNYIFMTASVEWAKSAAKRQGMSNSGRVCYTVNGNFPILVKQILES